MDLSARTDTELVLIFRSGDIQGFNTLFHRHWAALFQLANKILEDQDLAKDVVQETFVSLYENVRHTEIRNFKAYLLQMVKYQCFMQLRSGKISEKHLNRLQTMASFNNVEEDMDAKDLQYILGQKIESLPEKCREIFYLSRFEFFSNRRIAEHLNISQKTVEHQITKALKSLRITVDKLVLIVWFIIS